MEGIDILIISDSFLYDKLHDIDISSSCSKLGAFDKKRERCQSEFVPKR